MSYGMNIAKAPPTPVFRLFFASACLIFGLHAPHILARFLASACPIFRAIFGLRVSCFLARFRPPRGHIFQSILKQIYRNLQKLFKGIIYM